MQTTSRGAKYRRRRHADPREGDMVSSYGVPTCRVTFTPEVRRWCPMSDRQSTHLLNHSSILEQFGTIVDAWDPNTPEGKGNMRNHPYLRGQIQTRLCREGRKRSAGPKRIRINRDALRDRGFQGE